MPDQTSTTVDGAPSLHSGRWLIAALILAELVSGFEGSMVYAALVQFYRLYNDPVGVGWLVSGYLLVASIAAAICGRLGDIYGRKRVLLAALAIACIGSAISATSTQLEWIIAGRSIQGLSGAILPLCYGLAREHSPASRIAINIGIISGTAAAGAGVGAILGGVLVDHGSWRYIFLFAAGLAMAAIVLVQVAIPRDSRERAAQVDWLGGILFIIGAGLALYALGLGGKHGWGSAEQLRLMLFGLAVLAVWFWHELRIPDPMINVRMLATRQIAVALGCFSLASLGALNISQIIMVMIQQPTATGIGLGFSATAAGILHSPASILGVVGSPLVGWLAGRRGGKPGMIVALSILTVSWLGLAFAHDDIVLVVAWMSLNGLGIGALMAATPILIVEVAPADRVSEATGLAQIVRKVAMACGAQIIAVSLASSTVKVDGGTYPDASGYIGTFGLVAAFCGLALLLSLALPSLAARAKAKQG
jgi:MFS family permease